VQNLVLSEYGEQLLADPELRPMPTVRSLRVHAPHVWRVRFPASVAAAFPNLEELSVNRPAVFDLATYSHLRTLRCDGVAGDALGGPLVADVASFPALSRLRLAASAVNTPLREKVSSLEVVVEERTIDLVTNQAALYVGIPLVSLCTTDADLDLGTALDVLREKGVTATTS
jgi:hypothetical protein